MLSRAGNNKGGRYLSAALLCALPLLFSASPALAAGEVLFGIAGIVGAIGNLASIGASVKVAEIEAQKSVATTRIVEDTSLFLSSANARVALEQTYAAERINAYNQDSTTKRLDSQLASLASANQSKMELERERFQDQRELNTMQMALKWKQADANFELAKMSLSSQLVQAGLSTGFVSKNSGAALASTNLTQGNAGLVAAQPSRLLASVGPPPGAAAVALSRAVQIQPRRMEQRLTGSLVANGFVRGSNPGRLVASPVKSDLIAFLDQSDTRAARAAGRPHASAVVGASGHTSGPVSGRPIAGRAFAQ